MKKYLTLHNIILCCAAFVGVLFFGLSFAAKTSVSAEGSVLTLNGSVWGAYQSATTAQGVTVTAEIPSEYRACFPLPMIGFILLLVGTLAALCVGLLVKNEKIKKIALICSAVLVLTGGIFQFFNAENFYYAFAKPNGMTVEQAKQLFADVKPTTGALCIISGIFSIISACGIALVPFIKDKALTK